MMERLLAWLKGHAKRMSQVTPGQESNVMSHGSKKSMSQKRWCRAGFNIAEAEVDENEVKPFVHPEVLWNWSHIRRESSLFNENDPDLEINVLDHPDEEDPREEDLDEEIQ